MLSIIAQMKLFLTVVDGCPRKLLLSSLPLHHPTPAKKDDQSTTATATDSTKNKKVSLQVDGDKGKNKNDKNGKEEKIKLAGQAETESIMRGLVVISMAFFSLSDVLTQQCTARVLSHLLECGSAEVRAAVPLAMAVLNISHPSPALTDHLIRLTHDVHAPLAINSVLAIGLTAAGSNNSRSLGGISGFISETYDKTAIQIGRLAQGLVMLGQGTLTLSTTIYNNSVLSERSVVGLILILTQMLEPKFGLCGQLPIWTTLATCARPKILVTKVVDVNEPDGESEDCQIPVKMGQVQGGVILGRKTVLSGIQVTHTPVVIGVGNYVQVDDDDYTALSHCLEGTVLVTKKTMG
jgi:26S proteasome regulatory subunit N1